MMGKIERLKVEYQSAPRCSTNIMWKTTYPMRGGKFPAAHPCHGMTDAMTMLGMQKSIVSGPKEADDAIGRFRQRGYEASCFPEGDGMIVVELQGQDKAQVVRDIEECFGWEVTNA